MPRRQAPRAILDVASDFGGSEIATLRGKVLKNERNLRETYYDEVGLREGRRRWEFVKDFNHLISGQANIIAVMGAAQKNLVDGWTLEDYEEMEVSREEALRELEYEEVLKSLSKQHDNVEERKRKSREKIVAIWGEEWEVEFEDDEMPPWQSEHFLQHMFTLAKESPRQGYVLPVLRKAIEARVKKSRYTRKGRSLMAQDVKWAISEVRRREDESLASSAASEVPAFDGIATSAVGDALVAPPPRKWVRLHYDQDNEERVVEPVSRSKPAASASATSNPVIPHEQEDELTRRRLP